LLQVIEILKSLTGIHRPNLCIHAEITSSDSRGPFYDCFLHHCPYHTLFAHWLSENNKRLHYTLKVHYWAVPQMARDKGHCSKHSVLIGKSSGVSMLKRNPFYAILAFTTSLVISVQAWAAPGDILSSFSINNISGDGRVPITPHGIAYHRGYLWVSDFGTDRIYRVYPQDIYDTDGLTLLFNAGDSDFNIPITDTDNPPVNSDGNPIAACGATPGTQYCGGGGLTYALNYLWNASPVTDDIIKIDPVDGDNLESENALASLAFPAPTDMTHDGSNFWILDWQQNTITKVHPEDGTELLTIPGPSSLPSYVSNPSVTNARPYGLTWDGRALWVADREEDMIYRVSPVDGSLLNFFPSPGTSPHGLDWDGETLWHVDTAANMIYRIDSGVIPFGLAGCLDKNGRGMNGEVLLAQTATPDQSTTTDVDGCFLFPSFRSGVPMQITISELGNDEKPVITLTGGAVTLIVGDIYAEPGYVAIDTEDGDITADVVAVPDVVHNPTLIDTSVPGPVGGVQISYDVVDSAGNNADTVYRTVYVLEQDTTPPVITLNGDNPMYVEQDSSYIEPGATALDDRDGDISAAIVVGGSVNAAVAGSYSVTYNVSDNTGNSATQVTRTVIVHDTNIPVITLIGSNPLTLEKGNTFVDPGVTATDNIDGDITASVTRTGTVSSNVVGTYVLNYNVADSAGNNAVMVARQVNVVDTTAPTITLLGSSTINHELNITFTDPGATATDPLNDNLTASISVSGTVNTSVAGTYVLTYSVTDAAGNAATNVTRTVIVSDTGAPSITLLGSNPLSHELLTPFVDPGATATDAVDGDLTGSITTTGTVNINLPGTYTLNYNVVDSTGNAATPATRSVIVADTTPPTITMLGQANVLHELGSPYSDAGATANDNRDDNITASIVTSGSVNINAAGTYFIAYNVTDSSSNAAAPVTRSITVADRTNPTITLLGANPLNHEVGTVFLDPGASASDNSDGDISADITVSGSVNAGVIGTYTLTYRVNDSAGNAATPVSRTINVVDTGAPAISLIGSNPLLHELQTPFTDPGATASDVVDGNLTGSIVTTGTVNANLAGTYTLTYNVTDSQGNAAPTVTRSVVVADRTLPAITLTGSASMVVAQGSTYTEPGATASDNIDGNISASIVISGTVNTSVAGTYTRNYNVSDAAGNAAATVTRTITVSDTTAPVITLLGANPLNHEVGTVFLDPGASASDNIDGDISADITVSGSVNAGVIGTYTLTYRVNDSAGNAATPVSRTINVVDTGAPAISLIGSNPLLHELQTPFTDPGATASDAADGNLTGSIVTTGTVNANLAGTYTLTYNVTDSQGNAAPTVTRSVIVADRIAPVLALVGDNPQVISLGDSYSELGATATDNINGNLSGSIVINSSSVNTSLAGNYTVTYSVSDAAGNAANASRTVTVVNMGSGDTTPPTVTLLGANPQTIERGSAYTELGATAADNIDGDLTASIVINSSAVNTNTIGSYSVSYRATDSSSNTGNAYRTVTVVAPADTTPPVITLLGSNPQTITAGNGYTELGASATDNVDGNISGSIVINSSAVNTSTPGSYVVSYNVSDSSGNSATTANRTVNVIAAPDTTAPVIALIGANPQVITVGNAYTELGASATDNIDGNLTASIVIDTSWVNTNAIGSYSVSYSVSDSAGNTANASRAVNVVAAPDTTPPTINLQGANPQIILQGNAYVELGATATDNVDGNLTGSIIINASGVNTGTIGTYSVTYDVADNAGNNATRVTRTVSVVSATTTYTANPGIAVGAASVTSTMSITDNTQITDLNVYINMNHTYVGDISVTLTSPAGTTVTIIDRPGYTGSGYGCSSNNFNVTLDDAAGSPVESACNGTAPAVTGTLRPNNLLGAFNGESRLGTWTLRVNDAYTGADGGTLNTWQLIIRQ
jgi:subtilisin-like proprotein convertase family protein